MDAEVRLDVTPQSRLTLVRILHTAVWAFMVGCIFAIPLYALADKFAHAAVFIGIVLIETVILLLNHWRCPLTDVAARYTNNQHPGFDIYLPPVVAEYNKIIFGSIFVASVVFTVVRWFIVVGP